jgi:hypothetical protein
MAKKKAEEKSASAEAPQMRLVIFRNTRKTDPAHPDYTGKVTKGEDVLKYISLWAEKSDKTGTVYLSGVFNPLQREVPEEDLPF